MPSLINQMRNGTQPQQQQQQFQHNQQQQLNNGIARVRQMMQMVQSSNDPQTMLANIIQNNSNSPAIAQMLHGGSNLESIARNMAQQYNIDIDDLIRQLSQGQR